MSSRLLARPSRRRFSLGLALASAFASVGCGPAPSSNAGGASPGPALERVEVDIAEEVPKEHEVAVKTIDTSVQMRMTVTRSTGETKVFEMLSKDHARKRVEVLTIERGRVVLERVTYLEAWKEERGVDDAKATRRNTTLAGVDYLADTREGLQLRDPAGGELPEDIRKAIVDANYASAKGSKKRTWKPSGHYRLGQSVPGLVDEMADTFAHNGSARSSSASFEGVETVDGKKLGRFDFSYEGVMREKEVDMELEFRGSCWVQLHDGKYALTIGKGPMRAHTERDGVTVDGHGQLELREHTAWH